MADIPGLIEGAAEGMGLGLRFLKHLQRTRVLLHLVDIAPLNPDDDPVEGARAIVKELKKFSAELAARERWLVLNKIDLPAAQPDKYAEELAHLIGCQPEDCLRVSGKTGDGVGHLLDAVLQPRRHLRGGGA